MAEYARLVPATGAGVGFEACACCAAAFARRRACSYIVVSALGGTSRRLQLTIRRTCSGVGGFGGSLPAERVARGGVEGRSAML